MKTLVIIPSRLSATRLPGKPLLKIKGLSIISHVFKKAEEANIGEVIVATEDHEIVDDVKKNGGQAVLTKRTHKTGTDRIHEALQKFDTKNIDLVMNLQGDEPFMPIDLLSNLINDFANKDCDVISASHPIYNDEDVSNKNCVKVIINNRGYAEAFERNVSKELNDSVMRHIGIYGYTYKTLSKIISLEPTPNELEHKLEQLRFLDNNLSIYMSQYKGEVPPGIDTQEDVIKAEEYLKI